MPTGIYKRTDYHKKILAQNSVFKKGHTINNGMPSPMTGKKHSLETKEKMRKAKLGNIPWNKGLFGIYKQTEDAKKKMSKNNFHKNNKANKSPYWAGDRIEKRGYVFILASNHPNAKYGRVLEHRLVVEKIIGRYLLPYEEVHHLGERNDNRPQMLVAFMNKSAHQRFENGKSVKLTEIIFDGRKGGKHGQKFSKSHPKRNR
jgi:hypothetical protein